MEDYLNKPVSVITADGEHYLGILKGFDQVSNLVIQNPSKLTYSTENGVKQEKFYSLQEGSVKKDDTKKGGSNKIEIIRGSDVCCVALMDRKHSMQLEEHLEAEYYFQKQDLSKIKVKGIQPFY
eukprot:CAMPEP_0117446098 /NCGR_PEP_ID=MMETSP0759-20121206/6150_1 /TAXON_ID=63605 /ORGANISM="Percolomonas cosmopolitus, Strain WS" /LENGTH=123 /DNA_ID=CAMNT_0005238323 /DNA_START=171 /DNA_END=542 /DNA_ORIENTATION=+